MWLHFNKFTTSWMLLKTWTIDKSVNLILLSHLLLRLGQVNKHQAQNIPTVTAPGWKADLHWKQHCHWASGLDSVVQRSAQPTWILSRLVETETQAGSVGELQFLSTMLGAASLSNFRIYSYPLSKLAVSTFSPVFFKNDWLVVLWFCFCSHTLVQC